ncbi:hypothetical protein KUCAC02_014909 [Chaenocephalus aceratus]|uniref:Uncharacterized protein n=1 Tax=Chaenocephalus aceratus TaxID=36190 RepID=A0ACB9WGT1_CHAAC|nr:hypothetical protein KUCAC02_014909 [Chaenocephalus aceratus]
MSHFIGTIFRIRSDGPGPSRSDQRFCSSFLCRRSTLSRSLSHIPKNVNSKYCDSLQTSFSVPQKPKSYNHQEEDFDGGDVYENSADLSIYGNI